MEEILACGEAVDQCIRQNQDRTAADREFHAAIVRATHNSFMMRLLPMINQAVAAAIVSGVVGEIIMVVGYFGYAGLLLGKGIGAAASIPGNLVQAAMGLVIGFVLLKVMQKTRIAEKI